MNPAVELLPREGAGAFDCLNPLSVTQTERQVEEGCKNSLALWGLDYFDLYLVHFPISLQYIDPKVKFPQEWWGVDGKTVTPSKFADHLSILHSL